MRAEKTLKMLKMLRLINSAIDTQGRPKACTRHVTRLVIKEANAYNPGYDYGNEDTGWMNVKALVKETSREIGKKERQRKEDISLKSNPVSLESVLAQLMG